MRTRMFFTALALVGVLAGESFADGWFSPARRQQRAVERADRAERSLDARVAPDVPNRKPSTASRDYGRYPKFQGGFHSRELQNIGVPTGDTGMRGNGFSMYPW